MRIGPYQLKYLGSGGTATTHLGVRFRIDSFAQRCCVKRILPELRRDADFMKCFRREAAIGATLRHSNIVSLLEADVADGYLVFEFIDGVNLRELIRTLPAGRLSVELTVYIAMKLAEAFEYAHGQNVIHRDVSAANVMISCAGEVKLLDFGIAKLMRGLSEQKTFVRGKTQYMAPEHARNERRIDGRVDLFSLGVLCYELLAGRRPATASSDHEIYQQHLNRQYPPLNELAPEVPPELAGVISKLLEPDPKKRIASAEECFDALSPFAPTGSVRRELARLARNAMVTVVTNREHLAKQVEAEQRPAHSTEQPPRETHLTTPPTEEARKLLAAEQPTVSLQRGETDAVRYKQRRARVYAAAVATVALACAGITGLVLHTTNHVSATLGKVTQPLSQSGSAPSSAAQQAPILSAVAPSPNRPADPVAAAPAANTTTNEDEQQTIADGPAAAPAHNAIRGEGAVTVGVVPFSNVWINGEKMGMSPVNVRLPAGTYLIAVGDKRPIRSQRVNVRAGDDKEVFIDLTSNN